MASGLRTDLPFPTQPWEAAKARFLEGLSQEERQRFQSATLENIFYDASASQKRHAQGSRSWVMQEKIASLVEGIDDYGKALDVYSNAYGLVLCPIWGSIRVVLHIAREAGKFQEDVVDMFATIGDALPRFQIYQRLFSNHERLLRALSDAYLDILKFCTKAKQFFITNRRKLLPMSIVLRGAWRPFRQEFDRDMIAFRKHQKRVDKEAGIAHLIESARRREVELANQALQKHNDKINKRHRLLSTLQVVDYQAKHRKFSNLRHAGTNTWLQSNANYRSWRISSSSDCLSCYGIPGSGKSVLAGSVVNVLTDDLIDDKKVLCYYYFDYADARSLDSVVFAGSLVKQILVHMPLDLFDEAFDCPTGNYASKPLMAWKDLIVRLLEYFGGAFLVLDGVDELPRDSQSEILSLLDHLLQATNSPLKVFITSRTEEPLIRRKMQAYKSFDMSQIHVHGDITLFVEETLEATIQENPRLKDPKLRQDVTAALVNGANGMFLWVTFQMHDIRDAVTESAIRKTLQKLPKDLSDTYARIITKVYTSEGGEHKVSMMKRILQWVLCARRPLRIEELEEAVGLEKTDTYLHTDRVATDAGEQLIGFCGNLVIYDRTDRTVTLAHHTIQQFLCSPSPHGSQYYPSRVHFLSLAEADLEIGEICVAYLSFTDFETQVMKTEPTPVLGQEHAERIVWNRVPLYPALRAMVLWFGPAKRRSSHVEYAFPVQIKASPQWAAKYLTLEYVIEFWAFHTAAFTPQSAACWETFINVALYRRLLFEFRPWNLNIIPPTTSNIEEDKPVWKQIYTWAFHHGIQSFFVLLATQRDTRRHVENYYNGKQYGGTFQMFLELTLDAPPSSSIRESIWRPEVIYHFATTSENSEYAVQNLLHFLRVEFQEHASMEAASQLDAVFEGASFKAMEACDAAAYTGLIKCHIHTYDQARNTLMSMVGYGIDDSRPLLAVVTLRFSGGTNNLPDFDLELAFALGRCLPRFARASGPFYNMDPYYRWMLLLLILSRDNEYLGVCRYLIKDLNMLPRSLLERNIDVSNLEWTSCQYGTSGAFQFLLSLGTGNFFQIAFYKAWAVHLGPYPYDTEAYSVMVETVVEALAEGRSCTPNHCEIQRFDRQNSTQWLRAAIRWRMPGLVRRLMPHYEHYIHDRAHEDDAFVILSAATLYLECLKVMAEWKWPDWVLSRVKADPLFSGLSSTVKEILLEIKAA